MEEREPWNRDDDPGVCEEGSYQTSLPAFLLPFHFLLPLLVLVHLLLTEGLLVLLLSKAGTKECARREQ